MSLYRSAFAAAFAVIAATTPLAAASGPSQIIVFGDSLVDSGNINAAFGSDQFNPAAQGYFPGRFTNGPTYVDLLNQKLTGSLLTPALLGGTNFAFGSARAVTNADLVPDLTAQLGLYVSASQSMFDPDALYILNFGGNDVFALQAGTTGVDAATYSTAVVNAISGAVQFLDAGGAGQILVTGISNLNATGLALDAQLQARLDAIEGSLNAELLRFSYLDFFTALGANQAQFGVAPFTETGNCITSRTAVNGQIDCTGFFSFDGIHPTAEVQAAIYREVADITGISAVPEPAAWLLMIGGFGLIGGQLRRSRGRMAAATA